MCSAGVSPAQSAGEARQRVSEASRWTAEYWSDD